MHPSGCVTYAGVGEFSAPEGSVGVPPKVAACLSPSGVLADNALLSIELADLPQYTKTFVSLRPLGRGFHIDGADVIQIDIETVLLRVLARHATLSRGDILPVRHDGTTYNLRVEILRSGGSDGDDEAAVVITDTDLAVDILPSETVARVTEAAAAAAKLPAEPKAGAGVAEIMLRMKGRSWRRRFSVSDPFSRVREWVQTAIVADIDSDVRLQETLLDGNFNLVQAWLGHKATFSADNASDSLTDLGLSRPRLALGIEGETANADASSSRERDNLWAKTYEDAVKNLDERVQTSATASVEDDIDPSSLLLPSEVKLEALRGDELVDVFKTLVSAGVDKSRAATMAQKYSGQIRSLVEMGFVVGDPEKALAALEKYNGRLVRVVNALSS